MKVNCEAEWQLSEQSSNTAVKVLARVLLTKVLTLWGKCPILSFFSLLFLRLALNSLPSS